MNGVFFTLARFGQIDPVQQTNMPWLQDSVVNHRTHHQPPYDLSFDTLTSGHVNFNT